MSRNTEDTHEGNLSALLKYTKRSKEKGDFHIFNGMTSYNKDVYFLIKV